MRRIIAKVYVVNIADDTPEGNIEAATLAGATPANLKLTVQDNRKEDIASAIMHSGAVDLSPEKDSQAHRI